MGERMRRHRGNHKRIDRWHKHGAARGERVGGRTCGRGHDHSIGPVAGDEYLVDKEIVVIQAGQCSFVDHGIVENQVTSQNLFASQQVTLHQRTLLHSGLALGDRLEHGK